MAWTVKKETGRHGPLVQMSLVNSHLAAGGGCRGGSLPLPNPLPSPLLLLERYPARVPTTAALSSRGNRSTARLGGILWLLWITGLVKGRYLSTCCRNIPSTCARWWKRCVIRDGFVYEAIYEIYSFTSLFVLYLEHVYILRRNRKSFYVATSIRQSSADSTTIPNAK